MREQTSPRDWYERAGLSAESAPSVETWVVVAVPTLALRPLLSTTAQAVAFDNRGKKWPAWLIGRLAAQGARVAEELEVIAENLRHGGAVE